MATYCTVHNSLHSSYDLIVLFSIQEITVIQTSDNETVTTKSTILHFNVTVIIDNHL